MAHRIRLGIGSSPLGFVGQSQSQWISTPVIPLAMARASVLLLPLAFGEEFWIKLLLVDVRAGVDGVYDGVVE